MCARRSGRRGSGRSRASGPLPIEHAYPAPLVIGVLSDTHVLRSGSRDLPPQVPALFRRFGCDLILHAGDVCIPEVIDALARVAPVLVVAGNNDREIGILELAPLERAFTVGGIRVALLHGHGGSSARTFARARFGGRADLVVYGHSHIPMIEKDEAGTIYVNPGSPTDRRWHPRFGIGVIRIDDERIDPELILFDNPRELDGVQPLRG